MKSKEATNEKKLSKKERKKRERKTRITIGIVLLCFAVTFGLAGYINRAYVSAWCFGCIAVPLLVTALVLLIKKKAPSKILNIAAVVISIGFALFAVMNMNLITMDGEIMRNDVTEFSVRSAYPDHLSLLTNVVRMDMRDSTVSDFEPLKSLKTLKDIDVRGNYEFTKQDYDELRIALPKCTVHWSVPVEGQYIDNDEAVFDIREQDLTNEQIRSVCAEYPDKTMRYAVDLFGERYENDTTEITVADSTVFNTDELIDALSMLPDVASVDLTAVPLGTDDLQKLKDGCPEVDFDLTYSLPYGNCSEDVTSLTIPGGTIRDFKHCMKFFPYMNSLESVDLSVLPLDAASVKWLLEQYPSINFTMSFRTPAGVLQPDVTDIAITSGSFDDVKACIEFFPYLTQLQNIDISTVPLTPEQAAELQELVDEQKYKFTLNVFGVGANSESTLLKLDKIQVGTPEAVEAYLPFLPGLKQIDMCECGLTDEQMAGLRERHPEIKFVWIIKFGHYKIRTDVEVFTTYLNPQNTYGYTSETFAPLKYCTDMKFLDLGHNHITDISMIAHMTDMRYLILACNYIEDISPIAGMEKLQYVELFNNRISDFSALANKKYLVDVNICINKLNNVDWLLTDKKIRRLWIGRTGISSANLAKVRKALKGCHIDTTSGNDPTKGGWRDGKKYKQIKAMYWDRKFRNMY